jgi:signal transduction histidine kinase
MHTRAFTRCQIRIYPPGIPAAGTRLSITEQKQMPAQRLALQAVTHQSKQSVESFAHFGSTHRRINPRRRSQSKHDLRLFQHRQQALRRATRDKAPDGKIWFAAPDGVSVIDPPHLLYNKLLPPVHVEQIIADRKTYDASSAANGRVSLPAFIRDLKIDYTALSLVAPEKVLFRYKPEGRDRDWQDAGNRREAFYTDLPPRNYRFRVVACNNSGVWNEAGAFLDFSVAPAYYQTTLSCGTALLALLWGLYQVRLRQLAREFNAGLEVRVNERTRIARELHDSLLQGFQGLLFRLQAVREFLPGRPSEAMKALDIALERGDKVIVEGRDTISDLRQSTIGESDIAGADRPGRGIGRAERERPCTVRARVGGRKTTRA